MIQTTPRPVNGNVNAASELLNTKGKLIVWWYGGILKNRRLDSVPKVVVFFRRLDDDGIPRGWMRFDVALTHLGLLRIGSVWENGVCVADAVFHTEDRLDVNFSGGAWRCISPHACSQEGKASPISASDYPLWFQKDRNWLLDFPLGEDKNLLIPCLEFLSRCYGRSEEVPRILATYPWKEATERFYAPFEPTDVRPGCWPIKLRSRMRNGDTVFLAHARYDDFARDAARSIYLQIESAFAGGDSYAFPKVTPWFQGPANIKAKGLWINGGKTFLSLRVIGCSPPTGVPIQRDRENTNKTDLPADGEGIGEGWKGAPSRVLVKPPDIVNLTGDDAPNHGTASVEIETDAFEELGTPRVVIDVRREQAKTSAGRPGDGGEPSEYSTGERDRTGKGTGYASIHARPLMESKGTLRDMWEAMRSLMKSRPELLCSVDWFSPERGFVADAEPELIALKPFVDNEDKISTATKHWPYIDVEEKRLRGILLARIVAQGKSVYIVEIQRRPRTRKEENGDLKNAEETFRGLAFMVKDGEQFTEWLTMLLSEIRHVRGVVQKSTGQCPGKAAAFKHPPASTDTPPCQAAVLNALEKMGIEV